MSYWIYLEEDGEAVPVETFTEGGTFAIGGESTATVNVTYNYARHFPFRALHGRTGAETLPELEQAVEQLGTERSNDYWEPTPGNAGAAVALLRNWARQHPAATWAIS